MARYTNALRDLAREHGEEAFLTILEIMQNGENPSGIRLAAAQEILDRGFGKAAQKHEVDVNVFDGMTPEARALMNAACDYLTTMLSAQSDAGDATTIEGNASVVPPADNQHKE